VSLYNSSAQNVAADGLLVSSRDRREQPKKYSLSDIFVLNHKYASANEAKTARMDLLIASNSPKMRPLLKLVEKDFT